MYTLPRRLCPLAEFDAAEGSKAKEACFQKHRLDFTGKQFLKWNDDHTEEIDGTYVTTGTWPKGLMWAVNPLPETPTELFKPPCKSGAKPPIRALMAVGLYGTNPGPCAGNWPTTVNIMDHLRVPTNIAPGEYVLSFRWDCELTAQVWNGCSDIIITTA